jgi:Protein of unknown function (DUF3025)
LAHGLEAIDWSAPWLAHLREKGERVARQSHEESVDTPLHETLNQCLTSPVRFVSQSCLPSGVAYEQFIFETQRCPTRDGLHDFFNALCWDQFPRTKARLNQLQAEQIALMSSVTQRGSVRGSVRDALTVFDENGALLIAPPELWDALIAMDWQRLFVTLRPLWQQARLVPFGHALLEKLVQPRKPITAHVYITKFTIKNIALETMNTTDISDTEQFYSLFDEWIAADLSVEKLASKPFAPLPVLGIPSWCIDNENVTFYEDTSVFRSPRT